MMGRRKGGRGGEGGGEKRQVGQPMQILPEQRANQGGRQPLQRSGLPLVTERGDVREGKSEGMNSRGKEVWKYGRQKKQ